MKILLLGEYSGFYRNLTLGLRRLGHNCTFVSDGHFGQGIQGDRKYPTYGGGVLGSIKLNLFMRRDERQFSGYDIVFIINPTFIHHAKSACTIEKLKANNGKIILSACSSKDANYLRVLHELEVHPHQFPDGRINVADAAVLNRPQIQFHDHVVSMVDAIISTSPDYYHGYENSTKPHTCIPLPVDMSNIPNATANSPEASALQIFHGVVTGHDFFKGSQQIVQGCNDYREKGTRHHFIHDVIRPNSRYLEFLTTCDIVIDQSKSLGLGMNSTLSLAHGCITLTGLSEDYHRIMDLPQNPPIFFIKNSSKSVSETLTHILEEMNSHSRTEHKIEGQQFAREHFDAATIGQRYLDFIATL